MASAAALKGPTPASSSSSQPSVEQLQSAFDHSIWYLLSLWQPLHVACANSWGGPDSDDKKDWFAGAVSDLLTTHPQTDQEDLECFLLQIMQDEFDCNVEDETEVEVARSILGVRKRMLEERTLDASREVESRWRNRGQMKASVNVQVVDNEVDDDEEEWAGVEDDDAEMNDGEVPQLVAAPPRTEKIIAEVDEDGFTKVVGKKKR